MNKLERDLEELEDQIDSGEWVPRCGPQKKQKTPNQIRSAMRKYISEHGITQAEFQSRMHVAAGSYGKFMNTKYKDQWSACQNETYWAAARFLAIDELKKKISASAEKKAAKATNKRSLDDSLDTLDSATLDSPIAKKTSRKDEAEAELAAIAVVDVPVYCPVFANCDEVRSTLNHYLMSYGGTEAAWLRTVDAPVHNLRNFRKYKGKGAGAANPVYQKAWRFFEQKRILEGKPKSARRKEQEARWGPTGFPLEHDDGVRLYIGERPTDQRGFDIEYCQDVENKQNAQRTAQRTVKHG